MTGVEQTTIVDGSDMKVYVSTPEGEADAPGVVVLHGTNGVDDKIKATVDRLAEEGIAAIAPDLFHRGLPERPTDGPRSGNMFATDFVADIHGALAYLEEEGLCAPGRAGILGFCMGGLVAYLAAGMTPKAQATVAFYPSHLFKRLGRGQDPAPFDVTPAISKPILIFSGQEDTHPSPDDAARVDAELNRLGKVHEVHTYPGVGHAFLTFDANADGPKAYASKDAWQRCLAWFKGYL